jgi:serine-type anaerobic sulfatase-maturating enzyme
MPAPAPFIVMAKPAGPACDYACDYCYYRTKTRMFTGGTTLRMDGAVLEAFIRDYIAAAAGPEIQFLWQGGEPTLMGRGFFETAFALQQRHCPPGRRITNALQTHGGHLDDDWARLLKAHDVLVGLSIDGPRALHDLARRDGKGRSTFTATRRAVRLLQKHKVAFNTLSVVHAGNYRQGAIVYRYLRRIGVRHMQFIPLVERHDRSGRDAGPPPAGAARMAPWSVPRDGYGAFLRDVFDQWIGKDVGRISVQSFEVLLAGHLGLPSPLCIFAPVCGQGLVLEHDGGLYACDHFVYPAFRLGNITETPLAELAGGEAQQDFAAAKADLPAVCRTCPDVGLCHGGCPKHRFTADGSGGNALNYLCPSYRLLFDHTRDSLSRLAVGLGRLPA